MTGVQTCALPISIRYGSSLAFQAANVAIGGTFEVGQACQIPAVGRQLCAAIERTAQRIRVKVAEQVKAALNEAAIKREVAAAVREHLDTTAQVSILGVRRVQMQDGAVILGLGLGQ